MTRRMILLAIVSALLLIVAACEVEDADDEDGTDTDDVTADVVDDEPDTDDSEVTETDDEVDDPTPDPTEPPEPTPEPDPTATPEPEADPTATPEPDIDPEVGTRENPIPLGESAQIGDWELRVIEAIPDATDLVMEENQFNDPPEDGHQFFITRIEATYVGDESSQFWLDINLNMVDDGGVVYEGMDSSCGVIPDDIQNQGEAFTDATIEGNTCRSVQSEQVESALLIAEPLFSFDRERIFYALYE